MSSNWDIFFCFLEQVEMRQRFVSSFVVQTAVTFNTNELNMSLSILVGITNIMSSFLLAYTFIFSKSAEAFKFVNAYWKSFFFEMIAKICSNVGWFFSWFISGNG